MFSYVIVILTVQFLREIQKTVNLFHIFFFGDVIFERIINLSIFWESFIKYILLQNKSAT